jgi:hypothetical protein
MLFIWFSRLLHSILFLVLLYIFSYIFAPFLVEASPMTNVFINNTHLSIRAIETTGLQNGSPRLNPFDPLTL